MMIQKRLLENSQPAKPTQEVVLETAQAGLDFMCSIVGNI
jgi:hypothetical protein